MLYFLLFVQKFLLWCCQSRFLFCCLSFGCLRIFVFPGCIFESHLFCAVLEVAQHFLKLLFLRKQIRVHRQQISCLVRQSWSLYPKQIPIHLCFCLRGRSSFKDHLQNSVEEQARHTEVTLLGPFFDLEHVAFFASHHNGFLVLCSFSVGWCIHVRYRKIWGRPKLSCVW